MLFRSGWPFGYALAEAFERPIGLDRKLHTAKGFYGILCGATFLGVVLSFTAINPIKALYWSAVNNGLAAVAIMIVMMLMISNKKVRGPTATAVIGAVVVSMVTTLR